MKQIELLAPAGTKEAFIAAISAGADAVYIGGDKFSARAYAGNFDNEGIKMAVDYAHIRDVKVYVTMNTLIKNNEIAEAKKYIDDLYKIGVDALIIQDPGIAEYLRYEYPDFEIHASTQMTVHNGLGAQLLKDKGFKRIVLSRELSFKEIEYISKELGIETEIFVHGALCISYSGQCLISSLIGGRSGNRGRCAQACRMPYTLINKYTGDEKQGYLLSPKDISTIEYLQDVVATGASSLKIEGRMKKPEYVAGVVRNYREALNIIQGSTGSFNKKEANKELMQLFNRQGFNKAFFYGNSGIELMATESPKNTGLYIGKANKDLSIVLQEGISLKDGISYKDKGFTVSKIIKDGEIISSAAAGDKVKLYPLNYKPGDKLFKTLSNALMEKYSNLTPIKPYGDLQLFYTFRKGEKFILKGIYKGKNYTVDGGIVAEAINKPLSKERIEDNLAKIGTMPFNLTKVESDQCEEGFLPISEINDCRRRLLDMIVTSVTEGYRRSSRSRSNNASTLNDRENKAAAIKLMPYLITINTKEQLEAFIDADRDGAIVNLFTRKNSILEEDLEMLEGKSFYLKTPNIIKEELPQIIKVLERNIHKAQGIITSNLAIMKHFQEKANVIGDYKLNLYNSYGVEFYANLIKSYTLSVELNKKEIEEQLKTSSMPAMIMAYGKLETMIMEYCPIGSIVGGKTSNKSCSKACDKGEFYLKDRTNKEIPLITDRYCRCSLLNSVPLNLLDKEAELREMGVSTLRVELTNENYEETMEVLNYIGKNKNYDDNTFTRGHYKRGVE
ncbi:DUF3656 domain-containing U32 family peptidase [Alloiococcus sp. CFN-8]|uniref:DUF3656 domain-containing U32 family peptidase n=1 Tax=Alloiococcus sp. CFN-8 TaxID=3416081 RepID=UPI003CFA67A4